ncbi:tetratricopeptide repeat protein [Brevundimonas sp.]|uniref:tetratricopeptide repeat protein n=1 Tax=Brevundimonas sp. TaxID=1871086 RepID=UPI003D6D821F
MSGATASKRVLKTTVAAAAAGVVVFAPLAPHAEGANLSSGPVEIRVGANAHFTKIEFAGVVGARAQVRREGQAVVVRIGTTAAPDVSRLKVDPPKGVAKVETRAARGGTELVLTLAEGADARSGAADGAVWLNLYAPGAGPEGAKPSAVPAGGAVPVVAEVKDQATSLTFRWAAPVGAAVFRRGDAVWVVFDTAARMDMTGAKAAGEIGKARWAAGPDFTAIRIPAGEGQGVSARAEGAAWIVTLGGNAPAVTGVEIGRDDTAHTALTARMAGATRTVWLTDPMIGDRFAAVTALAPGKGLAKGRRTVDLALLPTAQGLAVETPTDDLTVKAEGDLVTLSRPRGLSLSPPTVGLEAAAEQGAPRKASRPALIQADWADVGAAGFAARHRQLQQAADEENARAAVDPRAPVEARLALTRFLVGSGLGYEAIGALNALVAKTPAMLGEPEVRGLRGAARASIGRLAEAEADFSAGSLAGDPSTRVWQGYIAAERGDWTAARQAFAAGAGVVDGFPPEWRARFGTAHALAAVETGDGAAARQLLDYVFSQPGVSAPDLLTARLVQAKLFELEGQADRALAVYKAVGRAPLDGISTPAKLGVVRLELAKGALKPDAAAAQLETLKWRWRGDATELAVIRTLGGLYLSQGRYREALTALKGAGQKIANLPGAGELQTDLSNAFRALFLEGAADGLQPVQALALFFDFRELTPVGADGDEMVRRLARRLIDVDLLDQAAELLKYQADNRLDGVAKAQVSTNLAAVHLMNRQPEQALQAIWTSRTTLLPTAMNIERRALEARALMELGRYDHALEILGKDASPAARDVRAEILWKQQQWGAAAAIYEQQLGARHRDALIPLTADEENRLIRAGVGYSLARDAGGLNRLSRNYAGFADKARSPGAIRIALAGLDGADGSGRPQDFATLSAGADTYAGWIAATKAEFRQKTGGDRAATPARTQAAGAA